MRTLKTYLQKFYFDKEETNFIAVKWKTGFTEFEIYHNQELIKTLKGNSEIRKGIEFTTENSGNIFVKMLLKPLGFEVQSGDRYLFNSRIVAEQRLWKISTIFNVIGGIIALLFLIGLSIELYNHGIKRILHFESLYLISFYIIPSFIFFVCAALVRKGYLLAFIAGLLIVSAIAIFFAYVEFYFVSIPFILFSFLILSQARYIFTLFKHRKALKSYNDRLSNTDVLDNIDI